MPSANPVPEQQQSPTIVAYDGACPWCSREVVLYQKMDEAGHFDWLDIRHEHDRLVALGIDPVQAHLLLHVVDPNGKVHVGLPAHLQMWSQLPRYRHVARLLRRSPRLAKAAERCYRVFARLRPGLYRQVATTPTGQSNTGEG